MGAFKYCPKCEYPLDKPTPREDLIDGQEYPSCDNVEKGCMTPEEWIVDLFDELEELREPCTYCNDTGTVLGTDTEVCSCKIGKALSHYLL
ncbi:hypothetical protein KAR91_51450 [Candidatus Pacearchaeota archaeon]|nr:hypothetical protein [Candidatus Pacearchaeota archaeon]